MLAYMVLQARGLCISVRTRVEKHDEEIAGLLCEIIERLGEVYNLLCERET